MTHNLYPIVRVGDRAFNTAAGPVIRWFRNGLLADRQVADITADIHGVHVQLGEYLDRQDQIEEFQTAVKDAWDAHRAIRYRTALDRFPREETN